MKRTFRLDCLKKTDWRGRAASRPKAPRTITPSAAANWSVRGYGRPFEFEAILRDPVELRFRLLSRQYTPTPGQRCSSDHAPRQAHRGCRGFELLRAAQFVPRGCRPFEQFAFFLRSAPFVGEVAGRPVPAQYLPYVGCNRAARPCPGESRATKPQLRNKTCYVGCTPPLAAAPQEWLRVPRAVAAEITGCGSLKNAAGYRCPQR